MNTTQNHTIRNTLSLFNTKYLRARKSHTRRVGDNPCRLSEQQRTAK